MDRNSQIFQYKLFEDQLSKVLFELNDLKEISQIEEIEFDSFQKFLGFLRHSFQGSQNFCKEMQMRKKQLQTQIIDQRRLNTSLNQQERNIEEVLQDLKSGKEMVKNELSQVKQTLQNFDDRVAYLQEVNKDREYQIEQQKKQIKQDAVPIQESIEQEMRAEKVKKTNLMPNIQKKQKQLDEYKQLLQNQQKQNLRIENELKNNQIALQNLQEIPERKEKDLRIYQHNSDILQKNLRKVYKQQENYRRQLNLVEKDLSKSTAYIESEKQTLTKKAEDFRNNEKKLQVYSNECHTLRIEQDNILCQKNSQEDDLKQIMKQTKFTKHILFRLDKDLLEQKRQYKIAQENETKMRYKIKQLQQQIVIIKKDQQEVKKNIQKIQLDLEVIEDEERLKIVLYDDLQDKKGKECSKQKKIVQDLKEAKEKLQQLNDQEIELQQILKKEFEVQELFSKKLVQSSIDLKSIQQDIAIKDLFVTNEQKRKIELEKKLSQLKQHYEQVKTDRNNYVSMIQMTSQDRSKLKEKFKTYQRELLMLQSLQQEKLLILQRVNITKQNAIKNRDKLKNEVNQFKNQKFNLKYKKDCLSNEIIKFTNFMKSLDKKMLNICKTNDDVCMQRNFYGQQLLQLNQELCYIYDQTNVKKFISQKNRKQLSHFEKVIKIFKLKNKNIDDKCVLMQIKIDQMPELSIQLIKLNKSFLKKQKIEQELMDCIQNEKSEEFSKELPGDDPSEAQVNLKLQVLEEVLNKKKEKISEHQIVFYELEKITTQLEQTAKKNRHQNLSFAAIFNDLKSKLSDTMKKVMMLVSELSIHQAIQHKKQLELQKKQNLLEEVEERIIQNLPPFKNSEILFLKTLQDDKIFQLQQKKRKQNFRFRTSVEPSFKKTLNKPRENCYIDNLGFPKPFNIKPFKSKSRVHNLKFFSRNKKLNNYVKNIV